MKLKLEQIKKECTKIRTKHIVTNINAELLAGEAVKQIGDIDFDLEV